MLGSFITLRNKAFHAQWDKIEATEVHMLKQAPFDDDGSVRAVYWKSLRDQGYSVAQANKMAFDKYPYPEEPNG